MGWGLIALTVPSFTADLLLYFTIMKKDRLFFLRRCLALSLFSVTILILVFVFGAIISTLDPKFIFPDFAVIVGLFAVIPPRALAVFSMSRTKFAGRALFSLLQPSMIVLTATIFLGLPAGRMITGLVLASLVGLVFSFALIVTIERNGRKAVGFSPIRMFRAFLIDWLEGRNDELESYLAELGVETEIEAAAFAFRNKGTNAPKAVMLVSTLHPGPFLNIGSSVMPFLFESLMERRFGAVAMVPHGVSGHELNLVSQEQNERILSWVLSNLTDSAYVGQATPVDRSTNEVATATSQVFDGCALVTMTTSPLDMEDVPSELANYISGLTHGKFRGLALIDAHNCLTGPSTMTPQKVGALQEAALASLQVSAEERQTTFKIGAAHMRPHDFNLKQGYGPGGISAIVVEVNSQRFAYVCVDGNNMIRGLREKILARLNGLGLDDGEIMTTDTHMVNGVVPARLGYHPVGEVAAWDPLVNHVASVCKDALANLEEAEVSVVAGQIPVRTLGQKSLRHVMSMIYRTSKLTAITLFPMVVVCAVISLLFLVR
jgi:putative membrane protein